MTDVHAEGGVYLFFSFGPLTLFFFNLIPLHYLYRSRYWLLAMLHGALYQFLLYHLCPGDFLLFKVPGTHVQKHWMQALQHELEGLAHRGAKVTSGQLHATSRKEYDTPVTLLVRCTTLNYKLFQYLQVQVVRLSSIVLKWKSIYMSIFFQQVCCSTNYGLPQQSRTNIQVHYPIFLKKFLSSRQGNHYVALFSIHVSLERKMGSLCVLRTVHSFWTSTASKRESFPFCYALKLSQKGSVRAWQLCFVFPNIALEEVAWNILLKRSGREKKFPLLLYVLDDFLFVFKRQLFVPLPSLSVYCL